MEESKQLFLRLLFLTAILFCLGLEVYTNYNTPLCNTELSPGLNCEDYHVLPEVDSFDNDQINKVYEPFYLDDQKVLIPIINKSFLFKDFSFSNWQPPKYS